MADRIIGDIQFTILEREEVKVGNQGVDPAQPTEKRIVIEAKADLVDSAFEKFKAFLAACNPGR